MTDRVARLDLEPIKERIEVHYSPIVPMATRQSIMRQDIRGLIAEVERLRSALLQCQDLVKQWRNMREKAADVGLAYAGHHRGYEAAGCCEALERCADDLEALLLCEAQGRRHDEQETDDLDTRTDA